MKEFIVKELGNENVRVRLKKDKYAFGGEHIYLGLEYFDEEYNFWGPYCDLTVNLKDNTPADCSFININTYSFDAEQFIRDNNLGTPTGKCCESGYLSYPLYKLNLEEIDKIIS